MVQLNGNTRKLRLVIVTSQPVPYRTPVYWRLSRQHDIDLHMVYCTPREPDRSWTPEPLDFSHEFLRERLFAWKGRYIHTNPGTWSALARARPDVLLATGFNPTHLVQFAFARAKGLPFVAATDGTKLAEDAALSSVHRAVRRVVYRHTQAFVGASEGAFDLYRDYGIPDCKMFKSHLCVDNAAFRACKDAPKDIDLLFSGRMIGLKNPFFAMDVAAGAAERLGRRLRMAMLGDGVLSEAVREAAARLQDRVEMLFPGFVPQSELPRWFGRARLFLFPSRWDPWGVVANEATAAALPTLVSPHAGAAHELIRDGVNGRVLDLDLGHWIDATAELLGHEDRRAAMAAGCASMASEFNYDNAAEGLAEAVRFAAGRPLKGGNLQILPASLRAPASASASSTAAAPTASVV